MSAQFFELHENELSFKRCTLEKDRDSHTSSDSGEHYGSGTLLGVIALWYCYDKRVL
jgi:hypothetical protein